MLLLIQSKNHSTHTINRSLQTNSSKFISLHDSGRSFLHDSIITKSLHSQALMFLSLILLNTYAKLRLETLTWTTHSKLHTSIIHPTLQTSMVYLRCFDWYFTFSSKRNIYSARIAFQANPNLSHTG